MDANIKKKIKRVEISAIITRADGTVEDMGIISSTKYNLLSRIIRRIKEWLT